MSLISRLVRKDTFEATRWHNDDAITDMLQKDVRDGKQDRALIDRLDMLLSVQEVATHHQRHFHPSNYLVYYASAPASSILSCHLALLPHL
jgi:hypothetical protein